MRKQFTLMLRAATGPEYGCADRAAASGHESHWTVRVRSAVLHWVNNPAGLVARVIGGREKGLTPTQQAASHRTCQL